ncbi:hypothetical protein MishRS11D_40850 [Methylomagnum ishizawai]|nr:hypothetical protein MishRS11D_40850 [Methylomagnum ishizawai]
MGLSPGGAHYRAYVGAPENYDLISAMTFGLLTSLGLRQQHSLLDIGCGSLRIGRLLIPYLNADRYFGVEPNRWLVEEGIAKEVGESLIAIKRPSFHFSDGIADWRKGEFDFAVAQSIFSHTGRDLLERWLAEVSVALKPGGALVATFVHGEDNDKTGWIYPHCVSYTPETIASMAEKHGFKAKYLDWRHPWQKWYLLAKPDFDLSWFEKRPLHWNTFMDHAPKK